MQAVKDVLGVVLELGKALDQAQTNNGKLGLEDLPLLLPVAMKVPAAISSAKPAYEEWKSATDDQRAEVIAWVKATFDIADDKTEGKIEAGLAMLVHAGAFFA